MEIKDFNLPEDYYNISAENFKGCIITQCNYQTLGYIHRFTFSHDWDVNPKTESAHTVAVFRLKMKNTFADQIIKQALNETTD